MSVEWCIHIILKIFWLVQISNQVLWARAKQKPIELKIRQRNWGLLDRALRRPPGDIAKAALECNRQGTRSRGTPRTTWRRTIFEEIRHQGQNGMKSKYSPVIVSDGKICEGPMFPRGMTGNYIYIYKYVNTYQSRPVSPTPSNTVMSGQGYGY